MKKFLVTTVLSLSMVFGFSAFALGAETLTPLVQDKDYATQELKDAVKDNGIDNANLTGVGVGGQNPIDEAKFQSVNGQRTHGEYQNNTNSCASCHQTHTAAASDLLFKDGVYATCTACHDGTLGILNVYESSTAGTFGGTVAGNSSMHMPDDTVKVSAAPGGHRTGTEAETWGADFNCASCHSPHGSYSDRLLKFNPNEIGSTDMYFRVANGTATGKWVDEKGADSTTPVKSGGLKVVGAQVVDILPDATQATAPEFVVYRTTSDSATLGTGKQIPTTQEPAGTPVIVLMKKSGTSYVRDMNPWIGNVYNLRGTTGLDEITNFYKGTYIYGDAANYAASNLAAFSANPTLNATKDDIIVKFGYAYVKDNPGKAGDLTQVKFADISRSAPVKLNFVKDPADSTKFLPKGTFNGVDILQVDTNSYNNASGNMGVAISQYCAACHTDYFVSAGTDASGKGKGVWSKAFRHNTTSDSYTCLKCHFAHGTDVTVMLDASDRDVNDLVADGVFADEAAATAYMTDKNNSSALKRYTNMSVCWKCHTSSHSEDLTNNQWVQGVNAGVNTSNEYNKTGNEQDPNVKLPQGWVAPDQAGLPYVGNGN